MRSSGWIYFLAMVASAASAMAGEGHEVGNGGNAVVCFTDSTRSAVQSVQLFDYWEMDQARPIVGSTQFGPESLDVRGQVHFVLERLERVDPERAKRYIGVADRMLDVISEYLQEDVERRAVRDDHPLALPKPPCYKVQFAIQDDQPAPGKRRFQINRQLWESPSTSNIVRAGLILHEVAYQEAIRGGQTDSDRVRYYNYAIATGLPVQADRNQADLDYGNLLAETKFTAEGTCSMWYAPNVKAYIPVAAALRNGGYRLCRNRVFTAGPATFETLTQDLPEFTDSVDLADFDAKRNLTFLRGKFTLHLPGRVVESGTEVNSWFFLDSSGQVTEIRGWKLKSGSPFALRIYEKDYVCEEEARLQDLEVQSCQLAGQPDLVSPNGRVHVKKVFTATRNRSGGLESASFWGSGLIEVLPGQRTELQDATFSESGDVVSGSLTESKTVRVNGLDASVWKFRVSGGRILGEAEYNNGKGGSVALYQGKPVLASASWQQWYDLAPTLQQMANQQCLDLGFIKGGGTDPFNDLTSGDLTVGGYTLFYDLIQNRSVGKVDEVVRVLRMSLHCKTEAEIHF
jgi:hypothetical protein